MKVIRMFINYLHDQKIKAELAKSESAYLLNAYTDTKTMEQLAKNTDRIIIAYLKDGVRLEFHPNQDNTKRNNWGKQWEI